MAYKIMHRSREQEIRFPTQAAAERYAEQLAGGLGNWTVVEAGAVPLPAEAPGDEVR
ncbi:hypothetical protein LWP59_06140 [Amycolatopsis acidiphila]|uniref:hypothetical protein n=1 Tax=Amycolatopsis acidiphila TaxID=715473 RepID=UPI0016438BB3|nr:hypothetical protein [Amycolatopsis acidiphila]UIJ61215.1 hypothetical protein LWP59_06140 [Amycolatopsis acidiphila]